MRRALSLFAAAVLAASAFADRDTAKFFEDRGEKAMRAKDYAGAEEHYRRALTEDGTYHAARFGLAEALLAAGRRDDAVSEFRKYVEDVRGLAPMPDGWASQLQRAEKRLEALDAAGNELRAAVDAQVAALVSFAKKWSKSDSDVAVKALRRVLQLKPGHAGATELLESLGRSPKGEAVPLFDGESLKGWIEAVLPTWSVKEGAVEGGCRDAAYICRTERSLDGDYDVRCEMRVLDEYPGPSYWAMCPAFDGRDGNYAFGVLRGRLIFQEDVKPDEDRDIADVSPSSLRQAFDPKAWNVFEIRFRGDDAVALVNGEEVGRDKRPPARREGFFALKVQNCRAQFRSIEFVPR